MRTAKLFSSLLLFAAACAVDPPSPETNAPTARDRIARDPELTRAIVAPRDARAISTQPTPAILLPESPGGGSVPNVGSGRLFFSTGAFSFPGGTTPGTATYDLAPVLDPASSAPPASFGAGTYQVTVAGTSYTSITAESMSGVFTDDTGTDYLVLSMFTEVIDPLTGADIGTVVHAIVLASDFAVGATVAFDGVDRVALFASGDTSLPDPSVAAAAVTGSITFTSGSLALGDLITASLAGDFGEIMWTSSPPPPPPMGGTITPGTYTLSFDPQSWIMCDGTLAGQEASFAGIDLTALNFAAGIVDVQSTATGYAIDGAPITAGFAGAAPLALDPPPGAPPGLVGGFVDFMPQPAGPLGTAIQGTYLMLDGDAATPSLVAGGAGAGFLTADQLGYCDVSFALELTP